MLQAVQAPLLPFDAFQIANRTAKVTMERDVRYWSAMYRDVPATGIEYNAATKTTPAQRASGSEKHSQHMRQHATSVRNDERAYQRNTLTSNER